MTEAGGSPGATPRAESSAGETVEGLVIRPMTKADLPAVLEIEKAVFTIPWTLATFAGLLGRENTRLWVVERGGELVGYAAVWVVADQAELGDLAVSEEWRGRGIGSRLLEVVLEAMRPLEVREVFLEVRESNVDAQRLYARYDFEEVGRRRGYYTRPEEDALVLRRLVEGGKSPSAESLTN